MSEMKTFSFVVSFLLVYTALMGSIPAGLLSTTYDNPVLQNIDPQLIAGFDSFVQYDYSNFSGGSFNYDLGGYEWHSASDGSNFGMGVIIRFLGIWVDTDWVDFALDSGQSRGTTLTLQEIQADASNGTVRYSAICFTVTTGIIFSWNPNDYTYAWEAWGNDSLYVIHGIGINDNAPQNAISLVLGMLTFSIAEIPFLIQILINSPIYAGVLYLIFFFVKEIAPF